MVRLTSVSMPKAMRQTTLSVRVTGVKRTRVRLRLGAWIFRFGALVMGCDVEIAGLADRKS